MIILLDQSEKTEFTGFTILAEWDTSTHYNSFTKKPYIYTSSLSIYYVSAACGVYSFPKPYTFYAPPTRIGKDLSVPYLRDADAAETR